MTLREEEKCQRVVEAALSSAELTELPVEPGPLLSFVRLHLARHLKSEMPPRFVLSIVNDLAAELDARRPGSRASGGSTEEPQRSRNSLDEVSTPFPRLRKSVANLVRVASTQLQAMRKPPEKWLAPESPKPSVILVNADRLARSTSARALISAQFEVSTFDSVAQALATLRERKDDPIVVLGGKDGAGEANLRSILEANSRARILALTGSIETTNAALAAVGIKRGAALLTTASAAELVAGVRRLA